VTLKQSYWTNNKQPMGCDAQLAWKWIFTPTFFHGWFWPVN